jgi:hypothetical protein
MRPVLAAAGGFVVSLGMFAGGVIAAASYLSAEPVRPGLDAANVASAWTSQAQRVDVANQDFERLPAATQPYDQASADTVRSSAQRVDVASAEPLTFASLEAEQDEGSQIASAAHLDWCHGRYRSYRESDNTYQPYSGGRKECVSPHMAETTGNAGQALAVLAGEREQGRNHGAMLGYADETRQPRADYASSHINDCFARYRSYRPSDNTYQPYGGGPRRQCQ